jgi:DNA-binding MarR family transcriptional regulator
MHPLAFSIKRAHLATVRLAKRHFRGAELLELREVMTPARYDVLSYLHGPRSERGGDVPVRVRTQVALRKALDLAAATISKMVKRLLELGLIWRRRSTTDRRTRDVGLTARGLRLIRAAFQLVHGGRVLADSYEKTTAVGIGPPRRRWRVVQGLVAQVEDVRRLAAGVGDRSEAVYALRRSAIARSASRSVHPPERHARKIDRRMTRPPLRG